jgi:hypothetical protein
MGCAPTLVGAPLFRETGIRIDSCSLAPFRLMIARRAKVVEMLPRKLHILSPAELRHLTIERLLAYRKKALSLENSLEASDYRNVVDQLDPAFVWFKDDPRWPLVYQDICAELKSKQARKT